MCLLGLYCVPLVRCIACVVVCVHEVVFVLACFTVYRVWVCVGRAVLRPLCTDAGGWGRVEGDGRDGSGRMQGRCVRAHVCVCGGALDGGTRHSPPMLSQFSG